MLPPLSVQMQPPCHAARREGEGDKGNRTIDTSASQRKIFIKVPTACLRTGLRGEGLSERDILAAHSGGVPGIGS